MLKFQLMAPFSVLLGQHSCTSPSFSFDFLLKVRQAETLASSAGGGGLSTEEEEKVKKLPQWQAELQELEAKIAALSC